MADEVSSQDTLTEADRLEIAQVRDALAAAPAAPAAAVASAPGETSPQPAGAKPARRIVKRHRHDPKATKSATAPAARSIKRHEQKPDRNVDRRKPAVELSACRRPEGFAGLLRALNLTQGCDT
jgi:hypothetical protein